MLVPKAAARRTDANRRMALQIAAQLPEEIDDARAVLAATNECLENFLIRGPREIVERIAPPAEVNRAPALFLVFATLLMLMPIGAALAWITDTEAANGWVQLAG